MHDLVSHYPEQFSEALLADLLRLILARGCSYTDGHLMSESEGLPMSERTGDEFLFNILQRHRLLHDSETSMSDVVDTTYSNDEIYDDIEEHFQKVRDGIHTNEAEHSPSPSA